MEMEWTLWEFFSWSLCPFYFNDTSAILIDGSFTQEEVEAKWYARRDENLKTDILPWVEVVKSIDLVEYEWRGDSLGWTSQDPTATPLDDDGLQNKKQRWINPEILKKVIQDEEWNLYRIIPMEYKFLKKYGLPLPRTHWFERLKQHFKL